MSRLDLLRKTMRDMFAANGLADAEGLADRAIKDIELSKRHQEIYEMRATMTVEQIHQVTGYSIQHIKRIQHDQVMIRRKAS